MAGMKWITQHAAPDTRPHDRPPARCARSCCWTPLGHSTARDHLPHWHKQACRCHREENR